MRYLCPKILILFFWIILKNSYSHAQCTYSQVLSNPNLVVNGNFSSGNTGFTSGYSYSTANPLLESMYVITNNAANVHFAFAGVDHTTGTGNFMVLNGSNFPTNVWNQSVNVTPNSYYNFSAWFKNIVAKPAWVGYPIATAELWINGVKISNNLPLPDYPDVWQLLDTNWFSGSATVANLSIRNIGISLGGNDFAIDDVAFKLCCTPTGSTSNITTCNGSTYQLNGAAPGSFSWSPTTGLNNPNILNPSFTANSNRTYILTKTVSGCAVRDTFNITIENCCFQCNALPSTLGNGLVACYPFTGNANDESGNGNHGTVFNAALTTDRFNKPNRAYSFNGTNARIQAPHSNSLNVGKITVAAWVNYGNSATTQIITKRNWSNAQNEKFAFDTKEFHVKRNGACTPNLNWNPLTYPSPPSIGVWTYIVATYDGRISKFYKNGILERTVDFLTPQDLDLCAGGELIFGANFATFPFYYTGKIDDIRIYNRALSDSEVSQLYLFSSTENLPTANAGIDIQVCGADSVQLNGTGLGWPTWVPSIIMSNSNVLTPKTKVDSPSNLILTTQIGTCFARDTVLVQPVLVSANAGVDTSLCLGDSVQLLGTGLGNLSWIPHTSLSNSSIANPYAKPNSSTNYVLRANTGVCNAYDTVRVSTISVSVSAGSDKSICPGDSVQLNGSAMGNYYWNTRQNLSDSLLLNPKVNPLTPKTYILTVQNGSCIARDSVFVNVVDLQADAGPDLFSCKRQSIVINGSGNGTQISWLPIKNILNNLSATPTVNPDTTTTYILTVSNSSCVRRDTVTVFVNPLDVSILTKDTLFCVGDTIQLNATTNSPTFNWLPNTNILSPTTLAPRVYPQNTSKYYISASDGICNVTDSVLLTLTNLTITVSNDTSICIGDSISLLAQSSGATFSWLPVLGLSDPNSSNPKASPSNTTNYLVQAQKGNCISSANVTVSVDLKPVVDAGPDQKYCFGESAILKGSVESGSDFIWSPAANLNDVKIIQPVVSGEVNREYILSANKGKCYNSDTVKVVSNPKVEAAFDFTPDNSDYPALVQFTQKAKNASFFLWDFDDKGIQSNLPNPSHTYLLPGKYEVWLKVSDSLNCSDSISNIVSVVEEAHLKVPNVFTPNGNSLNDSFEVVYTVSSFEYVSYQIYNRWGDLLYTTKFPGGAWWDGTYKNQPCPEGVYFFIVDARAFNGKEYNLHGTVTLLR
ncbi:MAG: gliding motility-associated C-terminal domain-containing protein [Bacteroidia bacterium]|nr:gliding motility-associated C-terminal domain-containing protein [Bacteroidia bacterium]